LDRLQLHILHIEDSQVQSKTASLAPTTIMMEAREPKSSQGISLSRLFELLPQVTIIRLDPQRSQAQLLTSAEQKLTAVDDLIELIQGDN
jgi:hypothetical protein